MRVDPKGVVAPVAEQSFPASQTQHYHYSDSEQMGTAELVTEVALAISYKGVNHVVMMVSPIALDDFILGFSLSEGIILSSLSLKDIEYKSTDMGIEADVTISERDFSSLKQQRRHLTGRTGCGICGHEALENVLLVSEAGGKTELPPITALEGLEQRIREWQPHRKVSGALHGALFVSNSGEVKACREDIGRHNALDKLIGFLIKTKVEPDSGFIVITSRCSYELIQKLARVAFPTLVSLSSPTTLAVSWAQQHNINLIHITKKQAPRVYNRSR